MNRTPRPTPLVPLVPLLLLLGGCSDVTGPPSILDQFNWEAVADPETVVEGIDASAGFGDIFILGQLATPSPCYDLVPDFSEDGGTLNLRIQARERNSTSCAEGPGAFRYTAVIRNLERASYELRVRHLVDGEVMEYTETLER